jgi:hypothetical protein
MCIGYEQVLVRRKCFLRAYSRLFQSACSSDSIVLQSQHWTARLFAKRT